MFSNKGKVLILAEKETFIIKVLIGKLKDAKIEGVFCGEDIDQINEALSECSAITYYVEAGERMAMDTSTFLRDRLSEENKQMIIVGDPVDVKGLYDVFPAHLILKTFDRPLNYEVYLQTINRVFNVTDSGDSKHSILIVDDDPNYMGLVREWLKDTYKIFMANSGQRAIKWLANNKADLILLDYEMPITSGPQVLQMIRDDEETKNIPIVFLTGKDDKESVVSVLALKPDGYILKTSGKEEIIATVQKLFMSR